MKTWEILNNLKFDSADFNPEKLIEILLGNRGIKTQSEIDDFLNPNIESLTVENLGIDKNWLRKSITRIKKAIKNNEQVIVFGDYDVDGITGSAIIWESLNLLGVNIMPYIPHRIEEGYGLSIKGIENVLEAYPQAKLIITVDNGIVANEAVEFANSHGLEVIVTDHHAPGEILPDAFAIVHSTKICGAAVGWFFCQRLFEEFEFNNKYIDHLGLVALATVTDVMQLSGLNRTLVKIGLLYLRKTKRPGLIELLHLAEVDQEKIGVYELGHVIGPRLNAMGRIEHAMDSLRFLCTPNLIRAKELANTLHITNKERQQLTLDGVKYAKDSLVNGKMKKLIFISDKSYQPGIIGLVSGKITEEFYRPSIVISEGEELSKGSSRSVSGFNIIEFIREFSDLLVDKGGHPMAAGFTLRTKDVPKLKKLMEEKAEKEIDEKLLVRKLKVDCELSLELINLELFNKIQELSPFGYGNSEPIFLSKSLEIENLRLVGMEGKHLKLKLKNKNLNSFDAILFGYDKNIDLKIGEEVDIVYRLTLNEWNGNKKIELNLSDLVRCGGSE